MGTLKRLLLLFLVGLGTGVVSGILLMQLLFIRHEKAYGMIGEENIADDFAKLQYKNADHESARQGLLYAVGIHRKMQVSNPKYWGKAQWVDLAWCLTELSVLEDSAGNSVLAQAYMAQADEIYKKVGAKDAAVERFKQTIRDTLPHAGPNSQSNGALR